LAREEGSTDDDDDAVDVDVAGDEAVVVLELLLRERDEADADQGDEPCLGERCFCCCRRRRVRCPR
jgi:hypothetical protein